MKQKRIVALFLFLLPLVFHSAAQGADNRSDNKSDFFGIKKLMQKDADKETGKKNKGLPANPPKKKVKGIPANAVTANGTAQKTTQKELGSTPRNPAATSANIPTIPTGPPTPPKNPGDLLPRIPEPPPAPPSVPGSKNKS